MIKYACLSMKYSISYTTSKKKNVNSIKINRLGIQYYDENNSIVNDKTFVVDFPLKEDFNKSENLEETDRIINDALQPIVDSDEFKELVNNNGSVYIYSESSSNDLGCLEYTQSYIKESNEFLSYVLNNYVTLDTKIIKKIYVANENGSRLLTHSAMQRRIVYSILKIDKSTTDDSVKSMCSSLNIIKLAVEDDANIYIPYSMSNQVIKQYINNFTKQVVTVKTKYNKNLPLDKQEDWIYNFIRFFDEAGWVFVNDNTNFIKNTNTCEVYKLSTN